MQPAPYARYDEKNSRENIVIEKRLMWLSVCRDAWARNSCLVIDTIVTVCGAELTGRVILGGQVGQQRTQTDLLNVLSGIVVHADIFRLLTMFGQRSSSALLFLHLCRRSRGCQRDIAHGIRQGCIRLLCVN